jgi:hypothetical protein
MNKVEVSSIYENFICMARLCEAGYQYGAHRVYMQNIIDLENGETHVIHLKYSQQLAFVKKSLTAALKFLTKRKEIREEDKLKLTRMNKPFESATTSAELLTLCERGTEILEKYKKE